jgi:hypothetical protein
MPVQKYNPKKLTGAWKGLIGTRPFLVPFIGGFMDDEIITAKYTEARTSTHEGADGTVTIVLSASELAEVTIMLSQGAVANALLSVLQPSAKRNFLPVGSFNFEDLNGLTLIKSPRAWIEETAEISFGKTVKGRSWKFKLAEAELFVGGSVDF